MNKYIVDWNTGCLIRIEETEPVCGLDYCVFCAECLGCFWMIPCEFDSCGLHYWREYGKAPQRSVVASRSVLGRGSVTKNRIRSQRCGYESHCICTGIH